jgi:hypothetical protein
LANQTFVNAQNAHKYSNDFLNIGVGARSFAMGNATVASVSDETAVYTNPANLTLLQSPINIGLMHSEHFAGLSSYDFGTVAIRTKGNSALAFSIIRLAVDNIPNTTELIDNNGNLRFDRITAFSAADYAFTLSYAHKMDIEGLSIGGNVKIINRIAGDFAKATGFGIDLGARYQMGKLSLGFMARDITTTFNSWTYSLDNLKEVFLITGNQVPEESTEITMPRFILASAYKLELGKGFDLLGELNLSLSTDGQRNVLVSADPVSIDPQLGIEAGYKGIVYLRGGINNIQKEYNSDKTSYTTLMPNMGIGIHIKKFRFDYALTDLGDVSGAGFSHVFSLALSLVPKTTKR